MKTIGILTMASIFTLSVSAYGADQTLVSTKAGSPIILDGMADKAWEAAKPITIALEELPYEPNNGYEGMRDTEVSIKSLYDDASVFHGSSRPTDPGKNLPTRTAPGMTTPTMKTNLPCGGTSAPKDLKKKGV